MEKSTEKPKTSAEVTPELIDAWKKQYPKGVHEISVYSGEEETGEVDERGRKIRRKTAKKGYVRSPNREDVKYASTMMATGGQVAYLEALLEEMWLGGDEELLVEDEYFFAAVNQIEALVKIRDGELKKL